MRVNQKLKIQNGWEGKGNHQCEGGNTVTSSILPFPFVFAFKETSGWPEEVKNEVTTCLHAQVAEFFDIGIQKRVPRLHKYLDKGGDYVEK